MSTLGVILLVVFAVISVILILMVLVQNDEKNGMGGMLGGGNTAAFGSHSGSVLKKATGFFVFLFFVLVFFLAFVLKDGNSETDKAVAAEEAQAAVTETAEEKTETNAYTELVPEAAKESAAAPAPAAQ